MRSRFVALAVLAVAGCASLDPYRQLPVAQRLAQDDALGKCARLFQASDSAIDAAAARDAQARRVPGFPYLRVDRLRAALAPAAPADSPAARDWHAALAEEDATARRIELRNAGREVDFPADSLAVCRQLFAFADRQELPVLIEAAQVPDNYSLAMRALGIYPLTRYAFAAGIRRWQSQTLAEFAAHADADPIKYPRTRYVPGGQAGALPLLKIAAPLGLPASAPETLARLIVRHAPVFEIETASDDDRPGQLAWEREPGRLQVGVEIAEPALYVRIAHTHFDGRWLLQVIYSIWFASRPPEQPGDPLAGTLDGLIWRVTLDEDGSPLVYDSIHPCGCYHLFVPTARVRARPMPASIDEGLFAPQTLNLPAAHERVVLKLAAGTHYLQRVGSEDIGAQQGIALTLRDDDELRALRLPDGGTRSVFGPDGLIAGSERRERFYFWPMGISSAGQMRQWGHHATAFVGRRHFDDPTLFDRYFEPLPPAAVGAHRVQP